MECYFSSNINNQSPNPSSTSSSSSLSFTNVNNDNNNKKKSKKKGNSGNTKKSSGSSVKLSTDPQSVAARERRHRISHRFKILQSMVPGGTKMDTVSMLDEAIHYVKFLKAQIWFHQHNIVFYNDACTPQELQLDYPSFNSGFAPVMETNPQLLPLPDSCFPSEGTMHGYGHPRFEY